jgi:vacuolar-type H+-ATPase subunit E/Vma4
MGKTEDSAEDKSRLIAGIEADARSEAEKIIEGARKAAEERLSAAGKRVEVILGEAEKKAEEQAEEAAKRTETAAAVENRRMSLRMRERIIRKAEDEARRRLASMIGEPEYTDILKGWIVEAAIGLNDSQPSISASKNEITLLSQPLLREVEKDVGDLTGRKIKLKVSKGPPLLDQGIVLTAADGKAVLNNQVTQRITRYRSEILKLVYKDLFGE